MIGNCNFTKGGFHHIWCLWVGDNLSCKSERIYRCSGHGGGNLRGCLFCFSSVGGGIQAVPGGVVGGGIQAVT